MPTARAAMPSMPQGRLYTCETRARRVTRTDKNGQDRSAGRQVGRQATECAQRYRGQQNGARLLHRPRLRRTAGPPRARFLRRLSHPAEGADEAGREAGPARPNGIALSPNGRTLYVAELRRAQHARLRSRSERRRLERARVRLRRSRACPAALQWMRRAICTSRRRAS